MKKVFYLFLVLLMLQGCAAYKSVHYGQDYSSPTDVDDIEIFSFSPGGSYIQLGEVTVFGVTPTNRAHMLERLKDMAAEMGGDAIIIEERETPTYMPKPIQGLVIKWQEEEISEFEEIDSFTADLEDVTLIDSKSEYIK
ncbi:MAG: hypothetical protein P9X27_00730 [Candidatus Kaelpia aquatica]|nr:hypothetical protein [Candidatus Kaelpia aquatica]